MSAPDDKPGDFIGNVQRRKAQEKALEKTRKPAQKPRRATNTTTRGRGKGYGEQGLTRELENIRDAPGGTRNQTTNTALFNLGQLIAEGLLDRTMVEDSVRLAARSNGLPDKEIDLLLRKGDGPIDKGMAAKPRDKSRRKRARASYTPPPPPPPVIDSLEEMEDGFWDARESLRNIYIGSLSRLAAPWAVIAVCTARALATVPSRITLPPLIGGPGSLNWFGAITAASGGGKTAAMACGRLFVTEPVQLRNPGSGEGMLNAYVKPKNDITGEPRSLWESLMFNVDEIDSLTAQSARAGSTTMTVLRSAFSGDTLGFEYVSKSTPRLEAHSYRMTMIVGVQPQRAAGLLEDAAGGTPQRFMWFPGNDKRVSVELSGGWVTPLTLPPSGEWLYDVELSVPKVCSDEIVAERIRNMRGESTDPLAGHALFVREKFAFGLALLDGRAEMSVEDWELSGVAAKVSDATRYWIGNLAEEARIAEAYKRGELQGVSSMAADEKRSAAANEKVLRAKVNVLKALKDVGIEGISNRDLARKLGREYALKGVALEQLSDEGLASWDEKRKRWYPGT